MPDYEVVDANDQTQTLSFADDPPEETTLQAAVTALEALDDALQDNATDELRVDVIASLPAGSNNVGSVDVDAISAPSGQVNGQKTVSTSGTAEALVGSSTTVEEGVTIKALSGNNGTVYVGDSNVDSTNGFELASGEQIFLLPQGGDLANIYLDVDTNGEGVSYIAS